MLDQRTHNTRLVKWKREWDGAVRMSGVPPPAAARRKTMSAYHTLSSRQHLVITGLALAVLVGILILLLAATPTVAASILSALIVLMVLAVVVLGAVMIARATPHAAHAQPRPAGGAVPRPLLLTLADGEVLVAREVDLGQPGEHRLLLTRKGYMLVNAEGEVIYRL
jgi:hypothetical protein